MDRPKKGKSIAGEVQTDKTKMKQYVLNALLESMDKTVSSSGVRHMKSSHHFGPFLRRYVKNLTQALIQEGIFV